MKTELIQPEIRVEVLDYRVALTSSFFQSFAIYHHHRAPSIFDEPGALQNGGRHAHAGPAGTKHLGAKFVGYLDDFRIKPDLAHKQLAGQALFDAAQPVTRRRLC